ncbi:FAD-dependent oxidoreductase [Tropicimonas marinistellae]|uniref:FAD-dependent oxidoreductase n=1 Tax=Tropicimonas marinistellae TaxID=1739787 RepID=UPI0008378DDB|nr:FAD-dependent oxidoreductase [Tropicimonas marinistellae]
MTQNAPVRVGHDGDIAWVTIDNPPVNATSTPVRAGLARAVEEVRGARVAILACAGRTFVAGGDMSEFDAAPVEPHLPDVVQAIEDSEGPFLALLHGNVLGGGLEIAMACAWRIAAPRTGFGLPEVNVGLIPGAGGSQRLPRLIGMEPSIDIACSGKIVKAEEMLALGGVDLVTGEELAAAARDFVANLPDRPLAVSQRPLMAYSAEMIAEKRGELAKRARGQTAPLDNLDALQMAIRPFSEAQPIERAKHLELRQSPQSRALRHAFFAERDVARPKAIEGADARAIENVVVVGGGLMGAGIATAMLNAGMRVTILERSVEEAAAAQGRVDGLVKGALARGKATKEQVAERLSRFRASDDFGRAENADVAIEAVFEDLDVKRDVFARLDAVAGRECLLATNTSYLDPRQIFEGVSRPERCLGLHFFSPAHVMKLLEIVRCPDTAPEVVATGFALGKRLRKVSVLSGICDGFIGNRMLAAYRREADYLLADGALPYQVDAAMRAFGMPMGPYELGDLTGLQIAWANRKRQAATRSPHERYVEIADRLCAMERFGQRVGKGWYLYEDGSRKPQRDTAIEALIEAYSAEVGITRRRFTADEISSRLTAVLANEGARIVEEGIAESDAAVDVVKLHGYGFPRWRGGPMHHANEMGWDETARVMREVAAESPGSWTLAERLEDRDQHDSNNRVSNSD